MPLLVTPRLPDENNREYAYRVLRSDIMVLNLLPGEPLNEAELSEQLKMSRTPVHEAIMALKNEWLVDVFPQRGSQVSRIRVDYVKEGHDMRMIMETSIIRDLAGRLPQQQLDEMKDSLRRQEDELNRPGREMPSGEFQELDNQFHSLLYKFRGMERSWTALRTVTSHYDRVRYLDTRGNRVDEWDILEQHRQLYGFLLIGIPADLDLQALYERHLGRFRSNFNEVLAQHQDYFEL